MERREFLNRVSLAAGLAVLGSSAESFAQVAEPSAAPSFTVGEEIHRNHGHVVALSDTDVIKLLRQVHPDKSVAVNITGNANHPHTITLTEALIVKLLAEGRVDLVSSNDGGHTHRVALTFAINEATVD